MVAYMSFLASETNPNPTCQGLLAGYSYGSMIVSKLPDPAEFLPQFAAAADGPRAEIVKRARSIALGDAASTELQMSMPEMRFLLVAPLLPPVTTLLALTVAVPFWGGNREASVMPSECVLAKHSTLAVYGSEDVFAAARRLRGWSEVMQKSNPNFAGHCVDGAGHFWIEDGAIDSLLDKIRSWLAAG